ncbi:hypothetical protein PF005_g32255 [Phytophthora fragariae]|uniref:Uncharacterized protein n=1 Tax=Phytophthora fragariae TaxID=53985 RepID=A0A6A3V0S6_9STRA|nr:hypothetical protein PF009_g30891 [Phytophthora fragariae]KAE8963100.1 hypothetical protein PF011_g29156 [Phytophthora fragariae]KAE9058938.1 hypothetical protein PF007_g31119 [Phytophthora fragariae]KAE9086369.1 hypothetical protein PF006_g26043 [Phytophthora fragariae]KAE9158898.1 hypothetical protein PF005_g32255 [Phytophthora fragariae]
MKFSSVAVWQWRVEWHQGFAIVVWFTGVPCTLAVEVPWRCPRFTQDRPAPCPVRLVLSTTRCSTMRAVASPSWVDRSGIVKSGRPGLEPGAPPPAKPGLVVGGPAAVPRLGGVAARGSPLVSE